jgi:hypothetical protein
MSISIIARTVMALIYLMSGIFLLIGNNIFNFTDFQKYGLGVLLVAYGIYRLYISLKKIKEIKNEEE